MSAQSTPFRLFNTRRGRVIRENLTAYLFVTPAMLLVFTFGVFPVAFAFFVSLHRWRRFPGEYLGLDNYVRGLGDFAYVVFFWIAIGAVVYGFTLLRKLFKQPEKLRALLYLIPGAISAAAVLLFVNWAAILLPIILNIPQSLRGQQQSQGLFLSALSASFQTPEAAAVGTQFLIALIGAFVSGWIVWRVVRGSKPGAFWFWATSACLSAATGVLLILLTISEINTALEAARAAGESLPVWSQVILISVGAILVGAGYWLWTRTARSYEGSRAFLIKALIAILLAAGGVILIMEVPRALTLADDDVLHGFNITVMFVLGTVPFQLGIGLFLAVLLFQKIKGKTLFRVVYFLPYIMPFVATSIVFSQLFSHRPDALVNNVINFFGIPDQKWLLEPIGVGTLILGENAGILSGPGLALVVIMIYTVWTYIGYDTVVFLAGLGNIPTELYEAARIDGADGWATFRHITLPLLSPTTFFLSLIAIIGTFQAFTQIWIMRSPASANSVDTIGVYIFETARASDPSMGYASALSFVLFGAILIFTLVQNRIQGRKVFYG